MRQLNTYPKVGTCPVCDGEQVEIGSAVIDEAGLHHPCTCEECNATWDECYDLIFTGHWNIYTGDDEECEDLPT